MPVRLGPRDLTIVHSVTQIAAYVVQLFASSLVEIDLSRCRRLQFDYLRAANVVAVANLLE